MVRCGTGRYRFKNKFKNRAKVNGAHPAKAGWALESQSQSQSQLRPPEGGRYKFKNKFKNKFKGKFRSIRGRFAKWEGHCKGTPRPSVACGSGD